MRVGRKIGEGEGLTRKFVGKGVAGEVMRCAVHTNNPAIGLT
jgi:hypothetical protein